MKAIQISAFGDSSVLEYKDIPIPALSPTAILVKNAFAGVNYIDTYHRSGLYKLPLPLVLGREGSAVVEKVGDQVEGFKVGDRVVYMDQSSYAEYTAVNSDFCLKIPDGVDLDVGAGVLLQGLTTIMLTNKVFKVTSSSRVLIHAAAGGTGQLLVQVCKHYGALVIGTASPEKQAIAKELGADHVFGYDDLAAKVSEVTGGKGVDVVYDGVGKDTFDTSLACLGEMGLLVSFGNASGKVDPVDIFKLTPKSLFLARPSLMGFTNTKEKFQGLATILLDLIAQKKIKFSIHKIYDLKDAAKSHDDLEGRQTKGKLVIRCS